MSSWSSSIQLLMRCCCVSALLYCMPCVSEASSQNSWVGKPVTGSTASLREAFIWLTLIWSFLWWLFVRITLFIFSSSCFVVQSFPGRWTLSSRWCTTGTKILFSPSWSLLCNSFPKGNFIPPGWTKMFPIHIQMEEPFEYVRKFVEWKWIISRNLTESHIGQIMAVLPDAFVLKREKIRTFGNQKEDYELVLLPAIPDGKWI